MLLLRCLRIYHLIVLMGSAEIKPFLEDSNPELFTKLLFLFKLHSFVLLDVYLRYWELLHKERKIKKFNNFFFRGLFNSFRVVQLCECEVLTVVDWQDDVFAIEFIRELRFLSFEGHIAHKYKVAVIYSRKVHLGKRGITFGILYF